nr:replication protein A 70 kDa DNA-binding subunit B-like [Ipomoea batatas]
MVRLIDFVLEDASENQLHCTVWDAHVDLLPHFNSTSVEPVVLLLQLCRPREVSELVGVSAENLLNRYGVWKFTYQFSYFAFLFPTLAPHCCMSLFDV